MPIPRHSRTSVVSTGETELAIATRRLMQTEASIAQAEACVLQQWNDLKAIVAKLSHLRHNRELEIAEAALKFAERVHARAEAAHTNAQLAETKAAARADAASVSTSTLSFNGSAQHQSSQSVGHEHAPNSVCDVRRPLPASSEQRHAVAGAGTVDSFASSSSTKVVVTRNGVSNARPLSDAKSCFADSLHH